MPDRVEAVKDQVIGNVKSFVGQAIGNEDMKKDAQEQVEKGDGEYKGAQDEDAANSSKDSAKGHLKSDVGGLFSERQKREGEADKEKASAEKEASKH